MASKIGHEGPKRGIGTAVLFFLNLRSKGRVFNSTS